MIPPRGAAAGLLVAAALTTASAQQPVFRSGVDLVTVDVTVLDDDGRSVEHLGPSDFSVRVDGALRKVLWAEYVPHRAETGRPRATSPAHFSSNEDADPGRLILIAVDQMHIRRLEGRGALQAAARFIETLDPADRVAAAPVTHSGPIQFTNDHASVKRYLEGLAGESYTASQDFNIGLAEALAISDGSRARLDQVVLRECGQPLARIEDFRRREELEGLKDPCPVQIEQQSRVIAQLARTQATLSIDALARLIARLREIDEPKALVLLSEGLVAEPHLVDLTSLGVAAQAARVTIYVLQLETPLFEAAESIVSPTLDADRRVRADGLARLAGSARGALFHLVGSDPHPFEQIARELSGYYLLAFEPAGEDRDGRVHRVEVRTRRSYVTVRARPAFRIDAEPAHAAADRLVQLLRSPRLATEIPLRVATYAFQGGANRVRLVVSAETAVLGQEVTFGFVLVDAAGRVVTSATQATSAGRYSFPVTVAPGAYLLRAAGVDAAGRRGSVERRLDVRAASAAGLRVSDLMLTAPVDGTSEPRPLVDGTPGDRVATYLELYAGKDLQVAPAGVRIDIARDDQSPALLTVPAVVTEAGAGRWIARAELDAQPLSPGSYVARAIVEAPGATALRVVRPFTVLGRR